MKTTIRPLLKFTGLLLGCLALTAPVPGGTEPTAFALIEEGNRHVGEDAKGRVVQIRSDKSVGTLTPNIWHVVFYDPDASAKATEVKFAAGKKVDVKRPPRILELLSKASAELPLEKLKIDSDRAIEIATAEPVLKHLTLTATRLELGRWEGMPVWKVRLWAQKLRRPSQSADIGEVFLSAEDGEVLRNRLNPGKVD